MKKFFTFFFLLVIASGAKQKLRNKDKRTRMKNRVKYYLSFVFALCSLLSSAQITFQKTYGWTECDYGFCIQQTTDDGYIVCGNKDYCNSTGTNSTFLLKTNSFGDSIWTKTFLGTSIFATAGRFVQQTTDGGFILATNTSNAILTKINSNGIIQWIKSYIGASYVGFLQQTTDGGFILGGYTSSFGAGNNDIYLVKTTSDGTTQWTKTFGGTGDDEGYALQQTTDGGYIITGYTHDLVTGYQDLVLIKTDVNGHSLWTNSFGIPNWGYLEGFSVQQTNDAGYIVTGDIYWNGSPEDDIYLLKTNSNGNMLWSETMRNDTLGKDFGLCIQPTNDGAYILTGYMTGYFFGGLSDVPLIKINSNGDTLWSKAYGFAGEDYGNFVEQTNDKGYIIAGTCWNSPGDVYLIKTDSLGNSGCNQTNFSPIIKIPPVVETTVILQESSGGTMNIINPQTGSGGVETTLCTTAGVNEIDLANLISVYPNPTSGVFQLQITDSKLQIEKIEIYNVMGEKVYSSALSLIPSPNGGGTGWGLAVDLHSQPNGIYFLQIKTAEGTANTKLIVSH